MKVIKVEEIPGVIPPAHYNLVSRRIVDAPTDFKGLVVAWTRMEPAGRTDLHTHEDTQHLFIVLKGELGVRSGEREVRAKPGEAILVSPGDVHGNFNASKEETEYISVTCALAAQKKEGP